VSAYRSNAPAKARVALVVRGKRQHLVTGFAALFALVPFLLVNLVTVECVRSGGVEGTCTVREAGPVRWRSETISMQELTGIRVDERVDGDGVALSRLVLSTTHGDIPLGRGSDNMDLGSRRELAEAYAAFRSGSAPTFSMTSGHGGLGFGAIWLAVCSAMLFVVNRRAVRVVVDPARGAVLVRRWFRTLHLPLTREVRVAQGTDGSGDATWHIVAPGLRIPLPAAVRPEDIAAFEDALEDALSDPRESKPS
jgi:hypothetical protein